MLSVFSLKGRFRQPRPKAWERDRNNYSTLSQYFSIRFIAEEPCIVGFETKFVAIVESAGEGSGQLMTQSLQRRFGSPRLTATRRSGLFQKHPQLSEQQGQPDEE